MKIGYACLAVGVPGTNLRTCLQKNATPDKLETLIRHNLQALKQMLAYNHQAGIRLFRISSDIIPFGSSPVNTLDWAALFGKELAELGAMAQSFDMRLSMHPGQYTVLGSPRPDVVERSIADLVYHTQFLDAMGLNRSHKLILHVGGIYGDKAAAVERFRAVYRALPPSVKKRLVIENDHKLYNIADVLQLGTAEHIPVVFDNLHHQIHPPEQNRDEIDWINACAATWTKADGSQKLHFSQQAPGKKTGAHSDRVDVTQFLQLYHRLDRGDVDIMLEVKDKNLSAVACLNCVERTNPDCLKQEWTRYAYTALERSPTIYEQIEHLLRQEPAGLPVDFYTLLHQALEHAPTESSCIQAALHGWSCFAGKVTDAEQKRFQRALESFRSGSGSIGRVKGYLHQLAQAYSEHRLLDSYYFTL